MFIWAISLTVLMYVVMKVVNRVAKKWNVDKAARARTRAFTLFVVMILATVLAGVWDLFGLLL